MVKKRRKSAIVSKNDLSELKPDMKTSIKPRKQSKNYLKIEEDNSGFL